MYIYTGDVYLGHSKSFDTQAFHTLLLYAFYPCNSPYKTLARGCLVEYILPSRHSVVYIKSKYMPRVHASCIETESKLKCKDEAVLHKTQQKIFKMIPLHIAWWQFFSKACTCRSQNKVAPKRPSIFAVVVHLHCKGIPLPLIAVQCTFSKNILHMGLLYQYSNLTYIPLIWPYCYYFFYFAHMHLL